MSISANYVLQMNCIVQGNKSWSFNEVAGLPILGITLLISTWHISIEGIPWHGIVCCLYSEVYIKLALLISQPCKLYVGVCLFVACVCKCMMCVVQFYNRCHLLLVIYCLGTTYTIVICYKVYLTAKFIKLINYLLLGHIVSIIGHYIYSLIHVVVCC